MNNRKLLQQTFSLILIVLVLVGCGGGQAEPTPTPIPPKATSIPPTSTSVPPTATPIRSPTTLSGLKARGLFAMAYDSESDRVVLFGGWLGDTSGPPGGDTWSYDPTTHRWTQMNPSTPPSTRANHDMVYDTESDRIILFGGVPGDTITYAYDFNTDTWTKQATGPSAQQGIRMAYDAESDRVILFGGASQAQGILNETWAYDFNTDSWTEMKPSTSPPAQWFQVMTYDAESDRVLMWWGSPDNSVWAYDFNTNTWTEKETDEFPSRGAFGGLAYDSESDRSILYGGGYLEGDTSDETWAYDYNTNTWTKMDPSGVPGELASHSMVYNPTLDLVVLFGGRVGAGDAFSAETWTYDLNSDTWTNVTPGHAALPPTPVPPTDTVLPGPQARGFLAMAYDSESDRVVLFGGELERAWSGAVGYDTWAYDPTTNRWTQMNPPIQPSAKAGHDMVYDAESDRIILYGGVDAAFGGNRTTWAYDFNTDTWTKQAVGPPVLQGIRMAYDAESDRVILFGGEADTGGGVKLNGTWAYDFDTDSWTEMKPSTSPPAAWFQAMTYDAESDRVLLWRGGYNASVWAYDFNTNTWTESKTVERPLKGAFGALAYDSESDRSILYGGGGWQGDYTTDETWAYDYNTNTWTKMEPGETPPELTLHAMAYSPALDLVVLFGGRVGAGDAYSAETWTYDLNSDTWTNVTLGQE